MLGDVGAAQDMCRRHGCAGTAATSRSSPPKAFLVTIVTRLSLNELDSARARREESRSDRLPEPVDLEEGGMARLEELEQLSMAMLVVLERLTPAERAVLCSMRRSTFRTRRSRSSSRAARPPAGSCWSAPVRKVAAGRRLITASREEHQRLLDAFLRATSAGDLAALSGLLAADAS